MYAAATFVSRHRDDDDYALVTGRGREMVSATRSYWRRFTVMGIASGVTYALVQIAFERAAVGYVTCLRESSVLIAAFVGARYLGEGQALRRMSRGASCSPGCCCWSSAARASSGHADQAGGGHPDGT